eukprot:gene23494-29981_t
MIRAALLRRVFAGLVIGPAGLLAGRARALPAFAPDAVPASFEGTGGGALLFRPDTFDAASQDAQSVPDVMPALVAGYGAIARPVHVLFGTGDQILPPDLHGRAFVDQVAGARCTLMDADRAMDRRRDRADGIMTVRSTLGALILLALVCTGHTTASAAPMTMR